MTGTITGGSPSHTWSLGAPTNTCILNDVNGRSVASGTGYTIFQDGVADGTTNSVLGLLAFNNNIYQATCNLVSAASGHIQWYKWVTGTTWLPSSDPRLLCNTDNGAGGGGEPPITCPKLYNASSIYNQKVQNCTAGLGCYYPSGFTLSGVSPGTGGGSSLGNQYPEGPAFYQATTTDPIVGVFLDNTGGAGFCSTASNCSPCASLFPISGSNDAPSQNGQAADDCLRPNTNGTTGTAGFALSTGNFGGGGIDMGFAWTAGFNNGITPTTQGGWSYRLQQNCSAPGSVLVGGVIQPCNSSPPYRQIYAPINAVRFNIANQGTDGHVQIFQPNATLVDMVYTTKLTTTPSSGKCCNNGDYTTALYFQYDVLNEMGDGYTNSTVSSMNSESAGAIMQRDLNNGVIDHAMSMYCSTDMCTTGLSGSTKFQIYPAYAHDNGNGGCPYDTCATTPSGIKPWWMGTRFVLTQASFNARAWQSTAGRIVGQAMVTYGSFLVDRGGPGPNNTSIHIDTAITDPGWLFSTGLNNDIQYIVANMVAVSAASCAGAQHPGTCPP